MNRTLIAAVLPGIFLLPSLAFAQSEVQAIIDKAIAAHGGKDRLNRLKARYVKSKGVLHFAGGLPFTQEIYYEAPSRIKETTDVNKEQVITTVFNGKEGWIILNGKQQKVDKKILEELKEAAHQAQITRLIGLTDAALKLAPVQAEDDTLGVKVAAKGYRDLFLFFDKKTGRLVRTERQALDMKSGELVKEVTRFSEWKTVDGITVPLKIDVRRDGKRFMEATATEVKFYEKLDADIFKP
ncbi:MAG: hypothetical protein KatS3mg105_4521 [Gemmatales bacterium]|nr:MAG: hypothetical protein KatS3mg105_4521 [Gemmatales bacterium]